MPFHCFAERLCSLQVNELKKFASLAQIHLILLEYKTVKLYQLLLKTQIIYLVLPELLLQKNLVLNNRHCFYKQIAVFSFSQHLLSQTKGHQLYNR